MAEVNWILAKGTTDKETVLRVQDELGVVFPESYILCVMNHPGGRPRPHDVHVDSDREVSVKSLLALSADNRMNVLNVLGWIRDRLPQQVIPIMDDNFGNYLCLDYRSVGREPKVVFWNHELAEQGSGEGIVPVAGSFAELLQSLH